MDFSNKICVVTGGAGGIGRCILESFLDRGALVAFIDTDEMAGNRLAARYPADSILFMTGDIAEEPTLKEFIGRIIGKFGHTDFLINNACLSRRGILSGCSWEDFNYVLRVGVTAPYYLTMGLLPHFRPGAAIVNIASTRAVMSQADTESYTAAKGGIRALTHALSVSLAGRVRANAVSPGWIDTGAYHDREGYTPEHSPEDRAQHPAGRVGTPEDIAAMVLYLCSQDAGFITGENITVDGGMTRLMIYHQDGGWEYHKE